jgi:hypothetical protein
VARPSAETAGRSLRFATRRVYGPSYWLSDDMEYRVGQRAGMSLDDQRAAEKQRDLAFRGRGVVKAGVETAELEAETLVGLHAG